MNYELMMSFIELHVIDTKITDQITDIRILTKKSEQIFVHVWGDDNLIFCGMKSSSSFK